MMRQEVKDYYYRDLKTQAEIKLKKEHNIANGIEEDNSIDEYLKDKLQKRIYEQFYQFFDNKYDIVICPLKEKEKEKEEENNNEDKELVKKGGAWFATATKEKKFSPGSINLKEKTTDFIKWISSIFQTINDTQISDYSDVNYILNSYKNI